MNVTDIVAEVARITRRADKIPDTYREFNKSLRKFVSAADMARDIKEDIYLNPEPAANVVSFPLTELVRFRKFAYLKPSTYRRPLELVTPSTAFRDCQQVPNAYYVTGASAVINMTATAPEFIIGHFQYPVIHTADTPEVDQHWLIQVQPYLLIDATAAAMFRSIGDDKSAQQYEADARIQWDSCRSDLQWGGLV